jgi:DNA-binding beta-propeller fold protein YncE
MKGVVVSENQRTYLKRWIGWIVFILSWSLVAGPALAADYCASNGNSVWYEWIDAVTVEASTQVSGANGGYADFTDEIIDLSYGANDVALTPGFSHSAYLESWRIWVDLNHDGVFDGSELLLEQASREPIDGQITVPETALTGTTRMRISMRWYQTPPSCGTFSYGEVEDYTVSIGNPLPALGKISDMVAGDSPQTVYAIDQDHQLLYTISTVSQEIVDAVNLPDSEPVAMAYSATDNALYIVSADSTKITVVDLPTTTISQFPFSESGVGRDIAVAPSMRLLFVLSPDGYDSYLSIVDMDTGTIELETTVGGGSIALDESSQTLFTADSGLSPSTIFKYAFAEGELTLVQSLRSGGNGRRINISPDGEHVVFPCGGGNGPGYTIYDYDAADLNNVLGEWDVGTYPKLAVFSPDNNILYGTNGSFYDHYLYVMDAQTYQQIRKLEFPNAGDYAVITPNADGTVVVGFSYDTYYDSNYALYFFSNVGP